jgi:hypothetical protein
VRSGCGSTAAGSAEPPKRESAERSDRKDMFVERKTGVRMVVERKERTKTKGKAKRLYHRSGMNGRM